MSDHKENNTTGPWGGGRSPFNVTYGKMMMWFFLISDALTFGGLLTAYGFTRHAEPDVWTVGEKAFNALPLLDGEYPLVYVALMTFILIISSVTMVLAVEAGHRNDKKEVVKWLGLTVVGGLFFVGSQAWEWSHFIHGSGGAFQVEVNEGESLSIQGRMTDVKNQNGEDSTGTFVVEDGERIFFSKSFYASMNELINEKTGGHGDEAHHGDDAHHEGEAHHAEDGHEDAHGDKYDAHDAGHDEHHHAHFHDDRGFEKCKELGISIDEVINNELSSGEPISLIIGKYTPGTIEVVGDEMKKLWDSKADNSYVFGANLSENEYGPKSYAQFFFFITGFHGFHVFSGVVINLIVLIMVMKGVMQRRKHYEMVEKVGLYWHFVDLVWVFVFTFFYLV